MSGTPEIADNLAERAARLVDEMAGESTVWSGLRATGRLSRRERAWGADLRRRCLLACQCSTPRCLRLAPPHSPAGGTFRQMSAISGVPDISIPVDRAGVNEISS